MTYAEPVVSNAFDMRIEQKSTRHVLLSKAFTFCFSVQLRFAGSFCLCTSTHFSRQDGVVAKCARPKGDDNHKWVGTTAIETESQFTDSLSTSTKQLGVFARRPSSLISSRKRLQVVKGGFFRPKRMLTGSSPLVGTLDTTKFAFNLCTATLMRRWKSRSFSAARSRRLLSAHRSASTVKKEVALVPNPPLVSKARGINSELLC